MATKDSEFGPAAALTGVESIPLLQAGANKLASVNAVAAFMKTLYSGVASGLCELDAGSFVPLARLPAGTITDAGTMSPADKIKLDGIATGATVYTDAMANARVAAQLPNTGSLAEGSNLYFTAARILSAVITDANTAHDILAVDSGKYHRQTFAGAKTVTFREDSVEALPANGVWIIRNAGASGDITLTPGGAVVLNPPAGGTLVVPVNGTVIVKRVAADVFDVSGDWV